MKITIIDRKNDKSPWEPRQVGIAEAIMIVFDQTLLLAPARLMNPFWLAAFRLTGDCHAITKADRINLQNCAAIRQEIRNYIKKRMNGEVESDLVNNRDLVSLMLENKDVFELEDIIDEVLDLMVAATNTQQLVT